MTRRHSRVIGFVAALVSVVAVRSSAAGRAGQGVVVRGADAAVFVPHAGSDAGASAARLQLRDDRRNPLSAWIHAAGLLDRGPAGFARGLDSFHDPLLPRSGGSAPARGVRGWRCCFRALPWRWPSQSLRRRGHAMSIDGLKGRSPGGMAVFGLLVTAVIFRKGICPAHAWVADAAEGGPAIPTALLLNGHLGALLVAKLIVPLFPHTARDLFPVLSYLALATALYVAIRALTENSPRRLLAFLALSQSACILAGLESRTAEGITGALVHWFVVTVSTMGLFGILRLLGGPLRREPDGQQISWFGRARAPAGGLLRCIRAGAGGFAGHAELLFPGPSDSRNAGVAPADRAVAADRHRDECGERFPSVRAAFSGQAANGFHGNGGCPAARAVDSGRRCLVRRFGRIVPECNCRSAVSGGRRGGAGDLCTDESGLLG